MRHEKEKRQKNNNGNPGDPRMHICAISIYMDDIHLLQAGAGSVQQHAKLHTEESHG